MSNLPLVTRCISLCICISENKITVVIEPSLRVWQKNNNNKTIVYNNSKKYRIYCLLSKRKKRKKKSEKIKIKNN